MQTVFRYDYGQYRDAIKQAKKLRSGSAYVWIVQHPKTRRYKVIEGECYDDRPTRVPILWEHYTRPPAPPNQREMDRDNLVWLAQTARQQDEAPELALAILDYLENYNV